ncbi:hypothetical protein EP7_002720 [Isosphaeraceae bacterium EP7]
MAGSQALRRRGGLFALAVAFLTISDFAQAQDPSTPAATPARSFADLVEPVDPTVAVPAPTTVTGPALGQSFGVIPSTTRIETGFFDTIGESLFGKPDPNTWRPLPLSTFFSEGWNEAWVPSPNGDGGAARQGWINAMDGSLYRLSFFTFGQAFNSDPKGNAYIGSYTMMAPLSRRLELIVNVPFVVRNNAASGLPILNPTGTTQPTTSHSGFGDMSFTPRFLLHDTKNFSVTSELAIVTPTGNQPLAGKTTTLVPAVGFWNNPGGGWAIRGGLGLGIPMNGTGSNLISQLAIGNTLTDHDVPLFGDFTVYVSAVANTSLVDGGHTGVTLTPGMRTHVGRDWYFLAGLPTPVTEQRIGDLGMIFWFMKAW